MTWGTEFLVAFFVSDPFVSLPRLQVLNVECFRNLLTPVQETVDAADRFPAVWTRYLAFLKAQGVWENSSALAFVTCGDWDLKTMLPQQLGLSFADDATKKHETEHVLFKRWINIKRSFHSVYGGKRRPSGLISMLKALAITHQGRHHSGIDDCQNLLSIVERMREDGWKAHEDPQLLLQM